nr:F-box/WD repeat-containing protein 5 isoform X2 [Megalopta genalis]
MDIIESALENRKNNEEKEIALSEESDDLSGIFKRNSKWCYMPDSILLNIFQYLTPKELIIARKVCKSWHRVSYDEFLWKDLFYQTYEIDPNIGMMPGKTSWLGEFKRLTYHIPLIETEELKEHSHKVLHVSFSHNGEMFATCSQDGFIFVWESQYPVKIKYDSNMKFFGWKYTQFSQFNSSDTLLLVSGTHCGTFYRNFGEIAVFSLISGFDLQCRVDNDPYDVYGTWYSEHYLLSGSLHRHHGLAHGNPLPTTSLLWLSKANQEVSSENIPILKEVFRFFNGYDSAVRGIMLANCITSEETNSAEQDNQSSFSNVKKVENDLSNNEDISPTTSDHASQIIRQKLITAEHLFMKHDYFQYIDPLQYDREYKSQHKKSPRTENFQQHRENEQSINMKDDQVAEIANSCEKYLIFATGSVPYYHSHQIAFKRVKNIKFPTSLESGRLYTLKERKRDRKLERDRVRQNLVDVLDYDDVAPIVEKFDNVDYVIDLYGHIVGMGLSPDHRYLYVNIRSWPQDCHSPQPPPMAKEIDIHVIDLMTFEQVGCISRVSRAHKTYAHYHECFDTFLDVCDEYVASGAEDKHAYLWDRHYRVHLAKFRHSDAVNCVAFNPCDSEMLVTTSDDETIKVWRSRAKVHELELNGNSYPKGVEIQYRNKHRKSSNLDRSNNYCFREHD